jgi:hypothetical protein
VRPHLSTARWQPRRRVPGTGMPRRAAGYPRRDDQPRRPGMILPLIAPRLTISGLAHSRLAKPRPQPGTRQEREEDNRSCLFYGDDAPISYSGDAPIATPRVSPKRFREVWEQVNYASSIDFPVVRCRLSASWTLQFIGGAILSRATPATRPFGPEWDLLLCARGAPVRTDARRREIGA